ncbi:hypothetical protein [Flagellimonas algicola]|uniref:Preprotein translocase subunit SecE n=1 Tax=Flagellimonas algicola TaxID=2583815 RepID=A0ABY2WNZ1_9FLAO|nr:hypothetical protein [Allomuricauda algicola]TMU56618.1 hypothetical protein FGG15_03500 [Allomuricauda algicola]
MVPGLILILLFLIWLFHGRYYSEYDPTDDDTEMDLKPSRKFWEYMARLDKLGKTILAIIALLLGLVFILNDVSGYLEWGRLF